jgi:hypothetical protein
VDPRRDFEALLLDEGTLCHYLKRYREGGIKGLISNHYLDGQAKLTTENLRQLDQLLRSPYLSILLLNVLLMTYAVNQALEAIKNLLQLLLKRLKRIFTMFNPVTHQWQNCSCCFLLNITANILAVPETVSDEGLLAAVYAETLCEVIIFTSKSNWFF